MLLSQLDNLFNEGISLKEFIQDIELEISDYKKSLEKKGGSSPIFLKEDTLSIFVDEKNIKFLCNAFLQGNVDKWALNYIAEALLLSERIDFSNNKVKDALLALTDAEYYDIINPGFVKVIMKEIDATQAFDTLS